MNMPIFSGDAADIEPLQTICRTLLEHGAWFHRDLRVHAEQGELSLHSRRGEPTRMSYLRVPLKLMPVLNDFSLTSDGKKLHCTPQRRDIPQVQCTLMHAMVELYNLTDKLTHWKASYPGFWHDQDEPLQHLFKARHKSACQSVYHHIRHGRMEEQTLADSFIRSRKFIMRAEYLQASATKIQHDAMVLLPLIDSLNHRSGADAFKVFKQVPDACMRIYSYPHGEQNELFISYNHYDPVDTLLTYGFVDESADFFFSVPCSINAGPMKIEISNPHRELSKPHLSLKLSSLGFHATAIAPPLNQELQIAGIPIPPPGNLDKLQTLAGIIGEASGLVNSAHDMKIFRQGFIEKLLEYNLGWWQTMEQKTRTLDAGNPLRALALKGLTHLNSVAECAAS